MAKQVPFFVVVNKKEVRTLQELRDNSHAQDVFSLYQNGVLVRWMRAIGEDGIAEMLGSINRDSLDGKEVLQAVFEAIGIKSCQLDSALHYMEFLIENSRHVRRLSEATKDGNDFIECYHSQYQDAKQSILENCNDMYFMRNKIKLISELYFRVFSVDFNSVIESFTRQSPAAVLLLLSNNRIRAWSRKEGFEDMLTSTAYNIVFSEYFKRFLPEKQNIQDAPYATKSLVRISTKHTDSSWDDIEPDKEKQFMILHIPQRYKVRDLKTSRDVANRLEFDSECKAFPIVNGIEYNSSGDKPLIYMEV